ncbi:MAG: hypothetical protein ACOYN5_06465 [Bacteroidales bacterium]
MKSLTNSYSTNIPASSRSTLLAQIEICCTLNRSDLSSTIITHAHQYTINARINRLLTEFESLEDNWDEDDAKAPFKNTISNAKHLTSLFNSHGQKIYHAAPGPNGEIMLDLRNITNSKSVEIIFYSTKACYVSLSKKGPKQDKFENEKLPEIMKWLNSEGDD